MKITIVTICFDFFFRIEPLSREEYLDQIHKHILLAAENGIDLIIMHPLRLSLFFIICAIATLFDTSLPDPVAAAEEWHHLSKASASLGSLMDEPSLVGTKTVVSRGILTKFDFDIDILVLDGHLPFYVEQRPVGASLAAHGTCDEVGPERWFAFVDLSASCY